MLTMGIRPLFLYTHNIDAATMNIQRLSIADQYEKLVQEDALVWSPVNKADLKPATILYLEAILDPTGLEYSIADQRLGHTVLFKVEHPTIRYLYHDSALELHMWAGEGFAEALSNDWVLMELARLRPRPRRLMDGIFELLRRC